MHEAGKISGFQFEPIKKSVNYQKNSSDEELNNGKSVILTKNDVSEWWMASVKIASICKLKKKKSVAVSYKQNKCLSWKVN